MRATLFLVLLLAPLVQAQLHSRILLGQNVGGASHIEAVAKTGDLDADGLPDFVAGEVNFGGGQRGVAVVSGKTGALIRTTVTTTSTINNWTVKSVAGLGDVTGDGVSDYAVGLPWGGGTVGTTGTTGAVKVFSGATGALIYTKLGTMGGDHFGWALSATGDQDGDGVDDILVGAPQGHTIQIAGPPAQGSAYVISGATGATIRTLPGPALFDYLGTSVARLGDADGDGIEDFAVGAPEQTTIIDTGNVYPNTGGYVTAYSGATGAALYTTTGLTALGTTFYYLSGFGHAMAPVGDVNGDGKSDLVVSAVAAGAAFLISGANGALITQLGALWEGAYSVAGAGDMNGDGIPDVAVGSPEFGLWPNLLSIGRVRAYSGTGTLLATLNGTVLSERLGWVVAGLGDQNGDGFGELAIASLQAPGASNGTLRVAGLAVADAYGASPATALSLGWTPVAGSIGSITLGGAPGAVPGIYVANIQPDSTMVGGVPILVSLAPPYLQAVPFTFPATGSVSTLLDLRQGPVAAGVMVCIQGAALPPASLPLVSNGLKLVFAP